MLSLQVLKAEHLVQQNRAEVARATIRSAIECATSYGLAKQTGDTTADDKHRHDLDKETRAHFGEFNNLLHGFNSERTRIGNVFSNRLNTVLQVTQRNHLVQNSKKLVAGTNFPSHAW